MTRHFGLFLLLLALVTGCATYPDPNRQRLLSLPQHYAQFDLVMGWETRRENTGTIVEGVVKNVRYYMMRDLEIWVSLLDDRGKVAARGMTFILPSDLELDRYAPFTVRVPAAADPGDRLRFTYKYRGSDGGDGLERGLDWMQSFEAVVPARQ